jgi:hypothetical protein
MAKCRKNVLLPTSLLPPRATNPILGSIGSTSVGSYLIDLEEGLRQYKIPDQKDLVL